MLGIGIALFYVLPLLGCALSVAFTLAELRYDDVLAGEVGFACFGLACGFVAIWILRSRRAQEAMLSDYAGGQQLAVPRTRAEPLRAGYRRVPFIVAALLVAVGSTMLARYHQETQAEEHHIARARHALANVIGIDANNVVVTLNVLDPTGRSRPVKVDVVDTAPYHIGGVVPILDDPADSGWVRLRAEPQDVTMWETGAWLAILLASVLVGRELLRRRAVQRLLVGEHPGIAVRTSHDGLDSWSIFATNQSRLRDKVADEIGVFATSPGVGRWSRPLGSEIREVDGVEHIEYRSSEDSYRPTLQDAVLLGALRHGGIALLVTADALIAPSQPLRIRATPPWAPRVFDGGFDWSWVIDWFTPIH
ncbi:hypothetical protein SAMN05444157_2513 [Frankineae bacterium MT45]|nr:hypothetical protein SAMN05444157_2513 [Frankineae bacterium MT45]